MILLDSCAVLEILFGEPDAEPVSKFLDAEQEKGVEVAMLGIVLLETSTVTAVRFKEGKLKDKRELDAHLTQLAAFQSQSIVDEITPKLIAGAARIKAEHSASMVDCYLIANALHRDAEILTADREILGYDRKRASLKQVSKRYSVIRWTCNFSIG